MKRKKAIIWGLGNTAKNFYLKKVLYKDYIICAFTDSNRELWGKQYKGIQIISPEEIQNFEFDTIIICSIFYTEIFETIIDKLKIKNKEILTYKNIEKNLSEIICEKYRESNNLEIQESLIYYQLNGFNIFGSYEKETSIVYYVNRDNDGMPYIIFENKKMYFPKNYLFSTSNGKECIFDILYEQDINSPHLYVKNETEIKPDSIIVDAGVCEGNFALRFIDNAKKIYLIESDPIWIEPLKRTFADYQDKVVFCNKFLARYDSESTITLDSLVKERIDFLKMDIEGAEIDALLGGKRVLNESNARCSICSYHKQNDEENIKFILNSLGYQTSTSKGYMFFVYDEDISYSMDFRRGIVYGKK